jgi:hypothetical protein
MTANPFDVYRIFGYGTLGHWDGEKWIRLEEIEDLRFAYAAYQKLKELADKPDGLPLNRPCARTGDEVTFDEWCQILVHPERLQSILDRYE